MKWRAKYPYSLPLPTSWQQLKQGDYYCKTLNDYFKPWFAKVYGQHILKIGGLSAELEWDCPNQHAIALYPEFPEHTALDHHSIVQACPTRLPFYENAIDACLLANTLNFSQDPHQLLREATRVLSEDGYLFISLFNPCSSLLFKRHLGLKNHSSPHRWQIRKYFTWRIIDWLELLNFEIVQQTTLAKSSAIPHFCRRFYGNSGQLAVIVARKRTIPLTLNPQKVRFKAPVFAPANVLTRSKERCRIQSG
ncbi:methyltransferase domain-containing protein [Testudinibacter aquarius]|uniref:Methyltransferase domain-containing protein n=1 Tax=Testudinibacter aquarius TaxID=1524974 RepID=A0A4R3Y0M8_9PAST|nr:methyltransferase domain-containing protein [Testudinibacter aquarius]KAE9528426.1 hypothetical protein A1D24_09390 [Testudinibacter aquarius]TCV84188.1 methyltransferase family protein [Testudinibacter aquarius]TNG92584.1 methyltransferase domain-containing protein [Testudinibacter aquarius]